MTKVIEINNLSKVYDLGLVGTGTLSKDLNRAWAKLRGKPDPYATLVELNDRTKKSSTNMVYALKDINFSVEQGEVLGIIGKNGAGKSTLLKILSQITSPSTGLIKMKGRVASLLEVGTGMHPEMTARQNIYLNGSLMGMRRHEITSKLDEIIDFAGIEKYIDTPIKRFSSGMKVRLGFAIAAFLEPEILIVDEVLAVGDAEFQKKAIGKMQDVSKGEGRTVLFVSHNMTSVKKLCSSGLVLENGMVKFTGTTEFAINNYIKENSRKQDINLLKRNDRTYSGFAKFKDLLINNNEPYSNFSKELNFRIEIISNRKINNVQIALTICSLSEHRICCIDSKSQGININLKKGNNLINVSCFGIRLLPSEYSIMAWMGEQSYTLDLVENAKHFKVEATDFYNSGNILSIDKHGYFYTEPASWKIE